MLRIRYFFLYISPQPNYISINMGFYLMNCFSLWWHACDCSCTVRVIKSSRAGVGKTLYKNRLVEKLQQSFPRAIKRKVVHSIPLHGKSVDVSRVVGKLLDDTPEPGKGIPRIIHFDVAYEVNGQKCHDKLYWLTSVGDRQDLKIQIYLFSSFNSCSQDRETRSCPEIWN